MGRSWVKSLIFYFSSFLGDLFLPRHNLLMANLALRSQLALVDLEVEQGKRQKPEFTQPFKLLWVCLTKIFKGWEEFSVLMKPETVVRWHRDLFRKFWSWKCNSGKGRPEIPVKMQGIIRTLSRENRLWSAERIRDHLNLIGISPPHPDTIRKYMSKPKRGGGSRQNWRTFLHNHLPCSWGMDFFTIPTLTFKRLYLFVILNHETRQVVHWNVTAHPNNDWLIQQLREAMPFDKKPKYLFRDNDFLYGPKVKEFLKNQGIIEIKTAFRSPWQNPFVERVGGTFRRELLNHIIPVNEKHLFYLVKIFLDEYYHPERPHLGLNKKTPIPKPMPEPVKLEKVRLIAKPVLGGLHHTYRNLVA